MRQEYTGGAPNGAHVTIIGLAGTKPGGGNTGASRATQAAAGDVSTSITSSANKSMVIAMVENSGRNNGSGTATLASGSPMTLAHDGNWGSQWGTTASGYQFVSASGTTITPTFNTAAGGNIHVVAAKFKASEISPDAYAVWPAQHPGADLTNPSADTDKVGLPVGIEWVVGGNPTLGSDDAGLAPTIGNTTNPDGKSRFTFRLTTSAAADTGTTIKVEYGSTLTGWTAATHQGTGSNQITITITITITEAPGGPGIDLVTVALPTSLADSGRLFVRLNVVVAAL